MYAQCMLMHVYVCAQACIRTPHRSSPLHKCSYAGRRWGRERNLPGPSRGAHPSRCVHSSARYSPVHACAHAYAWSGGERDWRRMQARGHICIHAWSGGERERDAICTCHACTLMHVCVCACVYMRGREEEETGANASGERVVGAATSNGPICMCMHMQYIMFYEHIYEAYILRIG